MEERHETLHRLLTQVAAGGDGENLVELIGRIDRISGELGDGDPAMLKHYLEKRSYGKALAFLEGRDETSAPNC